MITYLSSFCVGRHLLPMHRQFTSIWIIYLSICSTVHEVATQIKRFNNKNISHLHDKLCITHFQSSCHYIMIIAKIFIMWCFTFCAPIKRGISPMWWNDGKCCIKTHKTFFCHTRHWRCINCTQCHSYTNEFVPACRITKWCERPMWVSQSAWQKMSFTNKKQKNMAQNNDDSKNLKLILSKVSSVYILKTMTAPK